MVRGTTTDITNCLINIGCSKVQTGHIPEALRLFERASTFLAEEGPSQARLVLLYNQAWALMHWGHHSQALSRLMALEKAFLEIGNHYYEGLVLLALGQILLDHWLLRDARRRIDRALSLFARRHAPYERAKAFFLLAVCESSSGDLDVAMQLLDQAQARFERLGNTAWLQRIRLQKGQILLASGRTEQALRIARLCESDLGPPATPDIECLFDLLYGQCLAATGESKQTFELARSLLPRVVLLDRKHLEIEALALVGRSAEDLGLDNQAAKAYLQAAALVESISESLPPLDLRGGFLAGKVDVYQRLFLLAARKGDVIRAFASIERSKAVRFHYYSSKPFWQDTTARSGSAASELSAGAEELRRLSHQLRELRASEQRRGASQIGDLASVLESEATETLRFMGVRGHKEGAGPLPELTDVQEALGSQTTLLHYYSTGDQLWCLSATRDSANLFEIGSSSEIAEALQLFRYALTPAAAGRDQQARTRAEHHLSRLHNLLLAPVEGTLLEQLIVIPEGSLSRVPFHALLGPDREYMIDRHRLTVQPSAQCLSECSSQPAKSIGASLLVGVGDSVATGMGAEAEQLSRLIPGARLLLGHDATAAVVANEIESVQLVHFASHGMFEELGLSSPISDSVMVPSTFTTWSGWISQTSNLRC